MDIERSTSPAPSAPPEGLGARLTLSASSIRNAGEIDLPAGQITLSASGSSGGDAITLSAGSRTNVGGVAKPFFDTVGVAPGGAVALTAAAGNIRVESNASIDFSGASSGGDAGSLSVIAANGTFTVLGALRATAQPGAIGGTFSLDALSLSDFSALNNVLNAGGVTSQRQLRARTGDVAINAQDVVHAQTFVLEADQGRIDVGGTVDASAAKAASIELWSGNGVLLRSTGKLIATANTGPGGNVTLGASNGRIDLEAGSQIDVTGTTGGGTVLLRVPREGADVGITAVRSTISGAESTVVEGVRVYNGVQSIDSVNGAGKLNIATVAADNAAFMTNASPIKARLGKSSDATFHVRPGVEVRSAGALALDADWNLLSARSGGEPGTLTLRAAGNLNLNRSLSDAFSDVLPGGVLQSGQSWSYRLIGGADLGAAAPTAVVATQGANGGNVNLAAGRLVRTGTGDIHVAAGADIQLQGADSVIYTAGAPAAPLAGFSAPAGVTYSTGGGDISLAASRDVLAVASGQLITDWLYRQGKVNSSGGFDAGGDTQTSWWVSFKDFQQGVGALGGGNVHVQAGRDIENVSVVVPTNARMPGVRPDASNMAVAGGGDLDVRAAGDVRGGVFYLGRGKGAIRAGGSLEAPTAGGFAPILALNDGVYDVRANDGVRLAAAFNPTVAPQGQGNILNVLDTRSSHFLTYSPGSKISLTALNGDIALSNDTGTLRDSAFGLVFSSIGVPEAAYAVYPSSLIALALQGSIRVEGGLSMYPSARGDLQLRAARSINVAAALYMSDADPAVLPQVASPDPSYARIEESLNSGAFAGIDVHAPGVLHTGDAVPIRIYALDGSVVGPAATQADFFGYFPKAAHVAAGGDLRDVSILGQNVNAADVTSLQAGRDIVFSTPRNIFQQPQSSSARIEIGGPGQVELLAGRDIDLGSSVGVVTRGNIDNPALPAQGAGVSVALGLGRDSSGAVRQPAYQAFIDRYIAGVAASARAYRENLIAYLHGLQGADGFTDAEALATLRALPPELQLPFISGVLYNELKQTGRDAIRLGTGFDRGYAAIATLFPEQGYQGDLRMFLSQIKTEHGGDINLLVPGGLVNEGLANALASLNKPASDLGIVTVQGGSVRAMVDGDFLVNQSRIFTLQGGDILIWSSNGSIDAGKGAKSVSYAPPPLFITKPDGEVITDLSGSIAGSGIGLLLTQPDIAPGDVDLIAPRGAVRAGDAGIRSAGNIHIAAFHPPPPGNIEAAGTTSGLQLQAPTRPPIAFAGLTNPAVDAAQAVIERVKKIVQAAAVQPSPRLSFLSVEVIGLGQ